ncbi:uncharacterized protein EDB93DRAFT_1137306 [Suillus bovinus]|uniref:uncharacterized protein n=1 Tax=Suillus bovinus TaxID=48563 RepID=UPI001B87F626|nr:uncharacterized protein EDB93DRAFT_1137306 [Suillus bovinus]KAG2152575.1 hypothetical protein EDB93DRAFT_1137306 [Suillus bovinus]
MADALLALSAMRGLGSVTRRDNYLDTLIFALEADTSSRLRHAALRALFDARSKLVEVVEQEKGEFREKLLTKLAPALSTATKPGSPQKFDDKPDTVFDPRRDGCYLRLIFALAKQSDWRAQLKRAGHIDRCIYLLDHVIGNADLSVTSHPYYLAGTLIRMNASGAAVPTPPSLPHNISERVCWNLIKGAWCAMDSNVLHLEEEAVEALPDMVTYTLDLLKTPTAFYDTKSLVLPVNRISLAFGDGEAKLKMKRLRDAL